MERFWKNTLIVLTFANLVKPPRSSNCTPADHFSKRILEWEAPLRRILIDEAGIAKEVAQEVPIVPAGYSDEPSLPAANCDVWLSELWLQSLQRTKDRNGKMILMNINWGRLQPSGKVDITKKGYEQPLIIPGKETYFSRFW